MNESYISAEGEKTTKRQSDQVSTSVDIKVSAQFMSTVGVGVQATQQAAEKFKTGRYGAQKKRKTKNSTAPQAPETTCAHNPTEASAKPKTSADQDARRPCSSNVGYSAITSPVLSQSDRRVR